MEKYCIANIQVSILAEIANWHNEDHARIHCNGGQGNKLGGRKYDSG